MPTDKTASFSTKPICPKCGCEIPTDEIVVERDRAWCPNCRREMSFVEVADYSLVKAKRNEPLSPGFSIIFDSGESLGLSFKSARIGLRLLGLLFSILLAIPIPWVIYHMVAGHSRSYLVAGVALVALMALETWILLCRLRSVRPTAGLNSIMPFYDDETLFNEWIALERTRGSWWSSLPKCPGRLCLKNGRPVNPDPSKWKNPGRGGQILSRNHPGGVFEMRSLEVEGHGNQCVYDADGKVLVGPPSGGTVDWAAPGLSYLWGHGPHDVNTYELAERIKRIPDYYSVRPSR